MTITNFTPGPWKCSELGINDNEFNQPVLTHGPDGFLVADAGRIHHRSAVEQRANGYLIAAAPELYQLVSDMNTAFYGTGKKSAIQAVMARSRELLQKARGEIETT